MVSGASIISIALLWWSFGAGTPVASAAVSCPNDKNGRACPVGEYWCGPSCYSQGLLDQIAAGCSGGRIFTGCDSCGCGCPNDKPYFCNNQCTATTLTAKPCDAGFGPGSGIYGDACGTNCVAVPSENIIFGPRSVQAKATDRPLIDLEQRGLGDIVALKKDGANVFSANRTGLQLGSSALDLGAGDAGQNLLYGIANLAGMHPSDALMLLQTFDAGAIADRLRLDREGKLTVGSVCLGGTCKSSWADVGSAGSVTLQPALPGTAQSGNFNITGTGKLTRLEFGTGVESALEINAHGVRNDPTQSPFLASTSPLTVSSDGSVDVWLDRDEDTDGRDENMMFRVLNGASETVFYVTEGGTAILDQGITAGAAGTAVNIINSAGRIPILSATTIENLSGAALTNLNASALASGTVPDGRLSTNVALQSQRTTFTADTAGSGVLDGSLVVNAPTPPISNYTLFSAAVNGAEKLRLNTEGRLTIASNLNVAGGITAGSGTVGIVNAQGKIPILSSQFVADMNGSSLTNLNASRLASGTVPDARLGPTVVRETFDGIFEEGPWLTLQGGGSVFANTALRLYDKGTADANINVLEFAHSNGTGPVGAARITSQNVGANAANGALLTLQTTKNNTGTWNLNQLVLNRDGYIGIGTAAPTHMLTVAGDGKIAADFVIGGGDLYSGEPEYLNLWANNTGAPLYGAGKMRVGGLVVGADYALTAAANDLLVKGNGQFDGTKLTVGGNSALVSLHGASRDCSNTSVCTAICPANEVAVGGGCMSTSNYSVGISISAPLSATAWQCRSVSTLATLTAYVNCTKLAQ